MIICDFCLLFILNCCNAFFHNSHRICVSVGCQNDTYGSEFVVLFLEQYQTSNVNNSLRAGYVSSIPTSFTVSTPLISVGAASFYSSTTMVSPFVRTLYFPSALGQTASTEFGSVLENNGVRAVANQNYGLFGMSRGNLGSCDGFVGIPIDQLGTEYYTLCHWPPNYNTEIGIVATQDNTNVQMTIPLSQGLIITYNGVSYTDGQIINIAMNAYQSIIFKNSNDLSGCRIVSDKPVAVFSGNDMTSVGNADGSDPNFDINQQSFLVEQIPPVNTWGYTFFVYPSVNRQIFVRILASQPSTSVFVNNVLVTRILRAGKFYSYNVLDINRLTLFTTDKPALMIEYTESLSSLLVNVEKFPTMLIMPPMEQFRSQYWFATGELRSNQASHWASIIIEQSQVNQ